MTKEPIIIDDVDVSECFLYSDKICIRTKSKCNAICDYAAYVLRRQLKRKEQECERLRFPMKDTNYAILTKEEFEQLDQLKAENDKLKKTILQTCPNCGEAYIYHDGAKLIDKNFKLEQALQEIKQLTIEAKTKQFVDMDDFWGQILQKCEVLDE